MYTTRELNLKRKTVQDKVSVHMYICICVYMYICISECTQLESSSSNVKLRKTK